MPLKFLMILFMNLGLSCIGLAQNPTYYFYVSSESEQHPNGIALFSLKTATGTIDKIKEFEEVRGSSYLVISKDSRHLFTIERPTSVSNAIVTSFDILDEGKTLDFINSKEIPGKGSCYISQSESGNTLLIANYPQGNVVTFAVDKDGFIGEPVSNIYHQGSSINKERQESPHPHMIVQAPGSKLVLVPDLGIDKIMLYHMNDQGELSPASQPYLKMPSGYGPRHLTFHPSMKYGYVVNELNSTVSAFELNTEKEEIELLTTVSILPADFKDFNKSADILISSNGKFVFATNRGHNSVAILQINELSGEATFVRTVDCGGDWPRAFRIDPTGKFLLVANKNSGDISVFSIDEIEGNLEYISGIKAFPGPQCIRFIEK